MPPALYLVAAQFYQGGIMPLPPGFTTVEIRRPMLPRLKEIRRKISAERNMDARNADVIEYLLDEYQARHDGVPSNA